MATIKPGLFSPGNADDSRQGEVIEYHVPEPKSNMRLLKIIRGVDENIPGNDRIAIGVGNGIADYHAFKLVELFANIIHAPLYGTREAVARGLVGFDRQIGITGKTINPKLYIAIRISGSHNHLIGISKTTKIIAVNIDAEAEIVKAADYIIISEAKCFLEAVLKCYEKGAV